MPDPLTIATCVVSLADVALTASTKIRTFLRDFKDSHRDIERFWHDLQVLISLLSRIRAYHLDLRSSSSEQDDNSEIVRILESCTNDLDIVQNEIDKVKGRLRNNRVKDWTSRVRWILNKKKVKDAVQRLENNKTSLQIALSLIGR